MNLNIDTQNENMYQYMFTEIRMTVLMLTISF